jgi:hypothetical protein
LQDENRSHQIDTSFKDPDGTSVSKRRPGMLPSFTSLGFSRRNNSPESETGRFARTFPARRTEVSDYNLANDFRRFIVDEKVVQEERKRFELYIGKPQGPPVIK